MTTMVNGFTIPPELADAYRRAGSDPTVRSAIAAYYKSDPNPTPDGAAAIDHDARLRIAAARAESDERARVMTEAIRRGSACVAGCGGTREWGARDGLCRPCHLTIEKVATERFEVEQVAGGRTRREVAERYLAERSAAA
jgi:hypothetical protein